MDEAWKAAVLGGKFVKEGLLQGLWDRKKTVEEAREMLTEHCCYRDSPIAPKGRPPAIITLDNAKKRVAVGISRDCSRLLLKRLTPEARAFLLETQQGAHAVLGPAPSIEV